MNGSESRRQFNGSNGVIAGVSLKVKVASEINHGSAKLGNAFANDYFLDRIDEIRCYGFKIVFLVVKHCARTGECESFSRLVVVPSDVFARLASGDKGGIAVRLRFSLGFCYRFSLGFCCRFRSRFLCRLFHRLNNGFFLLSGLLLKFD